MADFYLRSSCRMCLGHRLQKVFGLTPTPPGNNFLAADEIDRPQAHYPLDIHFCQDCHHVQLGHVVDPKILYQDDYTYVSATSPRFVQHLREYAQAMIVRHELPPGSLVADIGSNDGTCLRFFKDGGMTVAGVDPATAIAERATADDIPTVGEFFSLSLARRLREQHRPAALITSHNACAHIDDLDDVVQGVRHWLADDGVFVLEVGYLLDVYQNVWFDTIYHEHLDYHSVAPFRHLFARHQLEPISVERVSPQGGSIRVTAQKAGGPRRADGSVDALVALEHEAGLDHAETFVEFGRRIDAVGNDLRDLVSRLKGDGRSIAGYGAATKATTLMLHFRLGRDDVDFIADDNPLKQGLFSPSTHIPVVEPAEIYRARPDYLLILAWNFAESIMAAHLPYQAAGGRFILPMPEARVVA